VRRISRLVVAPLTAVPATLSATATKADLMDEAIRQRETV
jgi:hypothetical protein